MTTITTQRNKVITEEPEPGDVFVRISLLTPGDTTGTLHPRCLRYQPISEYQAAVDWAVSIADQMAHRIYVVPLSYRDIRNTERFTPICEAVASMDDRQRGVMRRDVVNSMCEVLRDCDDWQVRSNAYDVLAQLKVIHHES
ncbi:hypothetical protein [Sphingobium sp. YR768]|uniref:hypothetical protein n=1 Tax=Sphingobium sp. YR768 TaxID=1884365 RepID=UPI0008BE1A77|nr:hypothetical protein [Sphingobium sp. YR768]SEQ69583.1 hypothetical protein SAMN05518866_102164 [Sphingobium sp. YR768]